MGMDRSVSMEKEKNEKTVYAYGGDFGDEPNDGHYCQDGLLFPDRRPKASLLNLKKILQPVEFKLIKPGLLRVKNKYNSTFIVGVELKWDIYREDVQLSSGIISLDEIASGDYRDIGIPYEMDETLSDCYLTVSLILTDNILWAEAGHELAWEQFFFCKKEEKDKGCLEKTVELGRVNEEEKKSLHFYETTEEIVITGNDFRYILDRENGGFKYFFIKDAS